MSAAVHAKTLVQRGRNVCLSCICSLDSWFFDWEWKCEKTLKELPGGGSVQALWDRNVSGEWYSQNLSHLSHSSPWGLMLSFFYFPWQLCSSSWKYTSFSFFPIFFKFFRVYTNQSNLYVQMCHSLNCAQEPSSSMFMYILLLLPSFQYTETRLIFWIPLYQYINKLCGCDQYQLCLFASTDLRLKQL